MIEKIKKVLEKEKRVQFAYLFGSFAKNKKYAHDVDIAVYVKGKIPTNFERKLALKLEKVVGKPVDVIVINNKPLLTIGEVLKASELIFSKNEKLRIRFETEKIGEYLDFNELMKEYDKMRFERYGIR